MPRQPACVTRRICEAAGIFHLPRPAPSLVPLPGRGKLGSWRAQGSREGPPAHGFRCRWTGRSAGPRRSSTLPGAPVCVQTAAGQESTSQEEGTSEWGAPWKTGHGRTPSLLCWGPSICPCPLHPTNLPGFRGEAFRGHRRSPLSWPGHGDAGVDTSEWTLSPPHACWMFSSLWEFRGARGDVLCTLTSVCMRLPRRCPDAGSGGDGQRRPLGLMGGDQGERL